MPAMAPFSSKKTALIWKPLSIDTKMTEKNIVTPYDQKNNCDTSPLELDDLLDPAVCLASSDSSHAPCILR